MWIRSTRNSGSVDDNQLLLNYQEQGDMSALGTLYDRYIELVFGVCMKYLRDTTTAQDATMEVFTEVAEKLKSHDVRNFRSWLYVVAKNHCLQVLRKQKAILTEDYDPRFMQSADIRHPEDDMLIENRENGLRECLEGLPDKQKRTVELFYFESKSYDEIAEILAVRTESVRSFIQNGRRNLKICMEKRKDKGSGN